MLYLHRYEFSPRKVGFTDDPYIHVCHCLLSVIFPIISIIHHFYHHFYHSFHQGIFPTSGLDLGLLPCRQILYQLAD